jgi:hypothetical protein
VIRWSVTKYKTGEEAPYTGDYIFSGLVNPNAKCTPTAEEKIIPLSKSEKFPPLKSCGEACYRELYRYR